MLWFFKKKEKRTRGEEEPFGEAVFPWPGHVSHKQSLRIAAVWACVTLIADVIAMLPVVVRTKVKGSVKEVDHPFAKAFNRSSYGVDSFRFKQYMMSSLLLRGNSYCRIHYQQGEFAGFQIYNPTQVSMPVWHHRDMYLFNEKDGRTQVVMPDEVLHIRGYTLEDLRVGVDPIRHHCQTLGGIQGANDYSGRFFRNDSTPTGVLTHPGQLSREGTENLRKSFEGQVSGPNRHRVAVMSEGTTYSKIGVDPEQAQLLQTREFGILEICRIFRVPPHMVGDLGRATWSNVEHQAMSFGTFTLSPWCNTIESAINVFLPDELELHFQLEAITRADILGRFQAYQMAMNSAFMTPNEIRAREGMNPVEGGDELRAPVNMAPLMAWLSGQNQTEGTSKGAEGE